MRASTDYWFLKALALCYAEPSTAMKRMQKLEAEQGISALVAKLQANPEKFGKRAAIDQSPRRQREAKQAATLLPLLAMTAWRPAEVAGHSSREMANAA